MVLLFYYFVTLVSSAVLKYNEIAYISTSSMFEFTANPSGATTITASGPSPITLLLREEKPPTTSIFDYSCKNSLVIPAQTLNYSSIYYLDASSNSPFSLKLGLEQSIEILPSLPIHRFIFESSQDLFTFKTPSNLKSLKLSLTYFIGNAEILVSYDDFRTTEAIHAENWQFGRIVEVKPRAEQIMNISVIGYENTEYTLVVDVGKEVAIADQAVSGLVDEGGMNLYLYHLPGNTKIKLKLSVFSGECDLYVKVDSLVSLISFDWRFDNQGSKIVEITLEEQKSHPGSNYSLGVYGKKASAYLLSIVSANATTEMKTGLPYIGSVHNKEIENFLIVLSSEQEIMLHLSAATGNPDLYVKTCKDSEIFCIITLDDVNTPGSDVKYSRNSFGFEEIDLVSSKTLAVGVYGASEELSEFSIVALIANSEMLLKAGTPQTATISNGGYRYYKYNLSKVTANELYFMLTPISGDPNLYISNSVIPNITIYDSSSVNSGLEVDSVTYIKGTDYETLNGTYHIAVHSEGPAQYSIVVKEIHPQGNTTIQLIPGISQKDTLYNTCMHHRLYYFPIRFNDTTKQVIRISITQITGKFNLYATNNIKTIDHVNRIFWYQWEANSSSTEMVNSIVIRPGSCCYKLNSDYAVMVQAKGFAADNSATYSIVLQIGNGMMVLADNSPFVDILTENGYNYYTYPVTLNREDVIIKLTAYSGSPMLYVSVTNPHPSADDYQLSSLRKGNNELVVLWKDLKERCPQLPDIYHHGDNSYCSVYISTYSETSSSYSLVVHASRVIYSLLFVPSTQFSLLSPSNKYFYAIASTEKDIEINTQSSIGSVKFFVSIYKNVQSNNKDIKMPSNEEFDFRSEVYLIHSQRLAVKSDELKKICGDSCLIAITVQCESEACEYFISVNQEEMVRLVDGEAFLSSTKENDFVFFTYYCSRADQDFIIDVEAVGSGDPDLYVRKSLDKLPSLTEFDWKAQTWSSETLLIERTDSFFIRNNVTITGTYIIGIHSILPCSFTIRVTQNPKQLTKLISGMPSHSTISSKEYNYYFYQNTFQSNILIKITPIFGRVVLYINTQNLYEDELYEKLPTSTSYLLSSISEASQHSLLINSTSKEFCVSCNIVIGVFGETDSEYSISVGHDLNLTLLENGVPQRGDLGRKEWKMYYFEVDQKSDLDFSLNVFGGDADIFISVEPEVSFTNSMWKSLTTESYEHISILKTDRNFKVGGYYVGVYSTFYSSFSLTAHIRESFVTLVSGWPQFYNIEPKSEVYFQYKFSSLLDQNISCNLQLSDSKSKPDVFVLISQFAVFAGQEKYSFKYSASDYNDFYSRLYMSFNAKRNTGVYITVKAVDTISQNFTLYCQGIDDTTVLKLSNEIMDTIAMPNNKKTYEVNVDAKGTLAVFVSPCEGLQELQISSNWTLAHMESPDTVVNRLVDGQLIGTLNNAIGRYYITVITKEESKYFPGSSYVLLITHSKNVGSEMIVPGNDGKILIESSEEGVKLVWNPPEYTNKTKFDVNGVIYRIFKLENEESSTVCAIMTAFDRRKADLIGVTEKNEFELKTVGNTVVNLIAEIPIRVQGFNHLTYDALRVDVKETKKESSGLLWLLLILIVVVMGVGVYFFNRTRKIKQRLDIELTVGRMEVPGSENLKLTKNALP